MIFELAAGVAIAAGNLRLLGLCWKRRSVLGGVLAAVGLPLASYAIVSGPTRGVGEGALVAAVIALVLGSALYFLGQALQRLLDEDPGDAV
jgi:hypothetical protein